MRFFKKKFRVRIKHTYEDEYRIQIAHYYVFPTWWNICFFSTLLEHGEWVRMTWRYKDAKSISSRFKSMEDVNKWYEPEEKKEKSHKEWLRKKYSKENIPCRKENIL